MRKTLISAVVAGLVVLMAPAAANATTKDITDPTGDVMTAVFNDQTGAITYHREHGAEGDITFARIQHTDKQIVVYLRYVQLSNNADEKMYSYQLEGNNHRMAIAYVMADSDMPQGAAFAMNGKRRCLMSHHINYANDSMTMRINRGCLDNPKYVRLSHLSLRVSMDDTADKFYYDSPTRDGGTLNQVQNSVTPWVVTG